MSDEENSALVNVHPRWYGLDTQGFGGIAKTDKLTPDSIQEALRMYH